MLLIIKGNNLFKNIVEIKIKNLNDINFIKKFLKFQFKNSLFANLVIYKKITNNPPIKIKMVIKFIHDLIDKLIKKEIINTLKIIINIKFMG